MDLSNYCFLSGKVSSVTIRSETANQAELLIRLDIPRGKNDDINVTRRRAGMEPIMRDFIDVIAYSDGDDVWSKIERGMHVSIRATTQASGDLNDPNRSQITVGEEVEILEG